MQLQADFQAAFHELIAPSIFSGEVAGALTRAERQKLIPVGDARALLGRVMRTPPVMHPFEPLLDRAVDISSQTRSGLYDCLYVALAEREGCELVTDDQKAHCKLEAAFPIPCVAGVALTGPEPPALSAGAWPLNEPWLGSFTSSGHPRRVLTA